ncbi:MAG: helix-turn-helix transcriptional regulator [Tabrizicola sp.]|jgi:DNA-binding HxlR family transcriptional regulator|nr:helix-turn-helix transcriptional regulator [Tabrizicola sp.]
MTEPPSFRSTCPIASALDLVGDRWTLVIARDMVFGAATFGDFAAGAERIPRNILADRLKKMEAAGLVRRERYQERPDRFRYVLTDQGAALLPVIQALARWGAATLSHAMSPPDALLSATPATLIAAQVRPDKPQV